MLPTVQAEGRLHFQFDDDDQPWQKLRVFEGARTVGHNPDVKPLEGFTGKVVLKHWCPSCRRAIGLEVLRGGSAFAGALPSLSSATAAEVRPTVFPQHLATLTGVDAVELHPSLEIAEREFEFGEQLACLLHDWAWWAPRRAEEKISRCVAVEGLHLGRLTVDCSGKRWLGEYNSIRPTKGGTAELYIEKGVDCVRFPYGVAAAGDRLTEKRPGALAGYMKECD